MPTIIESTASGKNAVTSSPPNARSDTSGQPSKKIVLKLSPAALGRFLPKPTAQKGSKAKSSTSSESTRAAVPENDTAVAPTSSPTRDVSESNSTTAPGTADTPKKKGGAKAGTKRSFGQTLDGSAKSRPKPGPKKRTKLDNEVGGKASGVTNGVRLGPKANQGAINAGLRALDRSGKPCRRWERKAFTLKSFTGVVWELPTWRAPKHVPQEADKEGSRGESKVNDSSTARESEKSNARENGVQVKAESPAMTSSLVVGPAAPAIAATG